MYLSTFYISFGVFNTMNVFPNCLSFGLYNRWVLADPVKLQKNEEIIYEPQLKNTSHRRNKQHGARAVDSVISNKSSFGEAYFSQRSDTKRKVRANTLFRFFIAFLIIARYLNALPKITRYLNTLLNMSAHPGCRLCLHIDSLGFC